MIRLRYRVALAAELVGRIGEHVINSDLLRGDLLGDPLGNPLGDPHERPILVYVPPG